MWLWTNGHRVGFTFRVWGYRVIVREPLLVEQTWTNGHRVSTRILPMLEFHKE